MMTTMVVVDIAVLSADMTCTQHRHQVRMMMMMTMVVVDVLVQVQAGPAHNTGTR